MTSLVPAVIDWLVAAAAGSPLLGGSVIAPVAVHDGPPVTTDTLAQQRHLWVGADPGGADLAAEAVQSFPVMDRARTREEEGDVILTADAWTGSSDMKEARDACAAIVAGTEALLRGMPPGGPGDATMGGLVMWAAVDGPFAWTQRQGQAGAGCACSFRVAYRARLLTAAG